MWGQGAVPGTIGERRPRKRPYRRESMAS